MKKKLDFNEAISIRYKKEKRVPVRLSYDESCNQLTITANVVFSKSLLKKYENKLVEKVENFTKPLGIESGNTTTFADVATTAITNKWSGCYDMTPWNGPEKLQVVVKVNRKDKDEVEHGQKCFRIQRVYGKGTSFVTSPAWRWLWGIFTGRRECFFTLNWTPKFPGTINMNRYSTKAWFMSTTAHEFGHVLGLGDAYDAFYRFFYEAPGTSMYMMNFNRQVHPEEIMMAIRAHKLKKMQYFPCEFSFKRVVGVLKKKLFNNH